jgi:hypothetical protein
MGKVYIPSKFGDRRCLKVAAFIYQQGLVAFCCSPYDALVIHIKGDDEQQRLECICSCQSSSASGAASHRRKSGVIKSG